MKDAITYFGFPILMSLILVVFFSLTIQKDRVDWLQQECLRRGYAEWHVSDDTYNIKEFKFKSDD